MREYRASGKFSLVGCVPLLLITLIAMIIVAAILVGVQEALGFGIPIIVPIIAGAIVGAALSWGIGLGKMRNPLLGLLIGLLAGALLYGFYHVGTYIYLLCSDNGPCLEADDFSTERRINRQIDNFREMMDLRAEAGIQITGRGGSSGIPITGNLMWIYWGVEAVIAAFVGAASGYGAATKPFNERTGKWFDTKNEQFVGNLRDGLRNDFLNKLKSGDIGGAGALLTTDQLQMPYIAVTVQRADPGDLEAESIVIVRRYKPGRSNTETEEVFNGVATTAEVDQLTRAVTGNMPTAPMPGALPLT
jgi:hypothetical protein